MERAARKRGTSPTCDSGTSLALDNARKHTYSKVLQHGQSLTRTFDLKSSRLPKHFILFTTHTRLRRWVEIFALRCHHGCTLPPLRGPLPVCSEGDAAARRDQGTALQGQCPRWQTGWYLLVLLIVPKGSARRQEFRNRTEYTNQLSI